jgi:hypothetical protein
MGKIRLTKQQIEQLKIQSDALELESGKIVNKIYKDTEYSIYGIIERANQPL